MPYFSPRRQSPQSIAASIIRRPSQVGTRTTARPIPNGPIQASYGTRQFYDQRPAPSFADAQRANAMHLYQSPAYSGVGFLGNAQDYQQGYAQPVGNAPQVRLLDSNPYAVAQGSSFLQQAIAAAAQQTRIAPGTLPDYKGLYRQLTEDQIGSPNGIQNNLAYQHTINSLLAEQGSPTVPVPLLPGQVAASSFYGPGGVYDWTAHNQARAAGYNVV
jgi:hypothetical protein